MRKKIAILLFLISISKVYGQINTYTPPDLNISAPSPFAFGMIKDMKIGNGEFTGDTSAEIDLLEGLSSKLNTSVSISYKQSGVKVEELPNMTGIGWHLNVGGVITREISDLVDEQAQERFNMTREETIAATSNPCLNNPTINKIIAYSKLIDTSDDLFNFKSSDFSGSFYLDANFKPVFTQNPQNVVVEILNDVKTDKKIITFLIRTINGDQYFFGGDHIEYTSVAAVSGTEKHVYKPTGYYLNQIVRTSGEIISYEYYQKERNSSLLTRQNVINLLTYKHGEGEYPVEPFLEHSVFLSVDNPFYIKKISSNFNDTSFEFQYLYNNYWYLSKINLFQYDKVIEQVSMHYKFTEDRFFLDEINYLKSKKKYVLEYNNPEGLPSRLSNSQDMLGYYNGKDNPSLVPMFHGKKFYRLNFEHIPGFPFNYVADRLSNFQYSVLGALKSITFPTKGKRTFEYEPAEKLTDVGNPREMVLNVYHNINNATGPSHLEYIIKKPGFTHREFLNFSLSLFSNNFLLNKNKKIRFEVSDNETHEVLLSSSYAIGADENIEPQIETLVVDGTRDYKIILEIENASSLSANSSVGALLKASFVGEEFIRDGFGLRVKSIKDIYENGETNYQRFYYKTKNGSYDDLVTEPLQTAITPFLGMTSDPFEIQYVSFWSKPTHELFTEKIRKRYETVTCSLGGDNFENGGYQKKFSKYSNDDLDQLFTIDLVIDWATGIITGDNGYRPVTASKNRVYDNMYSFIYLTSRNNRADFSGNETQILYFKKQDSEIKLVKQVGNFYKLEYLLTKNNLVTFKLKDDVATYICPNGNKVKILSNDLWALYNTYSIDTNKGNTQILNFIDSPAFSFNANNFSLEPINANYVNDNKHLTERTNYFYNDKNVVNKTITEQTDSTIIETAYSYANDTGNQKLIEANMIGIPLITETTKTADNVTKTISKTETIYPTSLPDAQTGNLLLPKSASSLDVLTGGMSTDVTYNQYDSNGNLLQYTTKSGISTAIVWGYNNTQPIAKIEGAKYSDVSAYITNIISKSDTDNSLGTPTSEQDFLDALDLFRKKPELSGFQITTYSYDPLIGVRSITPANGVRQVYIYDTANRLKEVREHNETGNVLKEYQYHYKPSN